MAGVQKGQKRPWIAGKPKFTNGDLIKTIVLLSDKQRSFLKSFGEGNVSAAVRRLVDQAMTRIERSRAEKADKKNF